MDAITYEINKTLQLAQNDSVSINSLPKLESKQIAQAYSIDDALDIMEGDWVELCERKMREGNEIF